MSNARTLSRSFAAGEITPELFGRLDLAAFQTGLATCRNFITLPHGPAANRPGFEFVREVKTSSARTRLVNFAFSNTQTFALEFGPGYVRFHTQGATLLSGGAPYEVATPYAEADLFDLHFVQSADVLTITHPNYAPRELRRLAATNWTLTAITFVPSINPPAGQAAAATAGSGTASPINHVYVITALAIDTLEESVASGTCTANNDLALDGAYNSVTWAAATSATRYNVYKKSNGLFGYIGQTSELTFKDDNIIPDVSRTPPELSNPFTGSGNYPGAVSYYEQRRAFGGTANKPQNMWLTRSATESNLSASIPVRDDDAISFRIAAREANSIRHIVPLSELILLTGNAEWKVTSVNSDALTPTSLQVKPVTYIGASNVQPVVTGASLLYPAAKGGRVRELVYTQSAAGSVGYSNTDVSLMAPHLFDFKTITDLAFARTPYPIVWAVSSDGTLLGLTYVPEQKVAGWHRHDTDGVFESVAVVTEGSEDAVYVVVRRTIGGVQRRYVERMHSRQFEDLADAFFVDSGLTYEGAPATTISGLSHLEGKTVAILADGAVHPQETVTGGAINLIEPASKVHIGLPITADLKTLPLAYEQVGGFGQGRPKNVSKVFLRVYRSSGVYAGPDENSLREYKQRKSEVYGAPPDLVTDEIEVMLSSNWNNAGHVFVRQSDPLPLTITSMCIEAAVGG
jgi:hypothetical protein